MTRRSLRIFAAGTILAATSVRAQQFTDLRTTAPPRESIVVDAACTVFGAGSGGLRDGLAGVAGAAISRDRSVIIFDGASQQLLAFDGAGNFSHASGGPGEGPGEFAGRGPGISVAPQMVRYRGDSIAVYDPQLQRVSVFDSRARFARSFRVDSMPEIVRRARLIGATNQGDFVLARMGLAKLPVPVAGRVSIWRDSVMFVRISASGSVLWVSPRLEDAELRLPVTAYTATPSAMGGGRSFSLAVAPDTSRAMRYTGSMAAAGDFLFHYREKENELDVFSRQGQIIRRVRLPQQQDRATGRGTSPLRKHFGSIAGDEQGRAWLEVENERVSNEREWWVIASTGELVAKALAPANSGFLWIGATSTMLRATDDDGVETVRLCALRETG